VCGSQMNLQLPTYFIFTGVPMVRVRNPVKLPAQKGWIYVPMAIVGIAVHFMVALPMSLSWYHLFVILDFFKII
jgi:hypothetical protein